MYQFTVNGVVIALFTSGEGRLAVESAREWVKKSPNGKLWHLDGKGIENVPLNKLPRKPAPRKSVTVKKIAKPKVAVMV